MTTKPQTDVDQRTSLQFTVGEIDIDARLNLEDYTAIDFIIRNLNLAKDYEMDGTGSILTRKRVADITSMQIGFYVFCALKTFLFTKSPPNILVFGTGFIGSKVIKDLIKVGCTPYIRIFSRGDEEVNYWKKQGICISTSLRKLYPNQSKADIIIICTPLSSFPVIAKQIKPLMNRKTMFIYTTIGLQRRRVFNSFQIPTILRTYQEPELLNRSIKYHSGQSSLHHGIEKMETLPQFTTTTITTTAATTTTTATATTTLDDDLMLVNDNNIVMDAEYLSKLSSQEMAADMIANRMIDIRNLIYQIENYYAIRGLDHPRARYEALLSILNYNDVEYETYKMSLGQLSLTALGNKFANINIILDDDEEDKITIRHNTRVIKPILSKLSDWVGISFQRQFSKYIKVINLPRINRVIERLQEINKSHEEDTNSSKASRSITTTLDKYINMVGYDGTGDEMHTDNLINKMYDQDRKYIHTDNDDDDNDNNSDGGEDNSIDQLDGFSSLHDDSKFQRGDHSYSSKLTEEQLKALMERQERVAAEETHHQWLMSTVDQMLKSDHHDVDFNSFCENQLYDE